MKAWANLPETDEGAVQAAFDALEPHAKVLEKATGEQKKNIR